MDAGAGKPVVVVRPAGRTAFDPRTHLAARELVTALSSDLYDVSLQLPDPGQFSVQNSLESIGIFVSGGVTTPLLNLIVKDLHDRIASWMERHFTKNEHAGAQYVTIYGPDNKPLKNVLGRSADNIKDVTPRGKRADRSGLEDGSP
jgi:hypothetical protein